MQPCDIVVLGAGSIGLSFALTLHEFYRDEATVGVVCSKREGFAANVKERGVLLQAGPGQPRRFRPSEHFQVFDRDDAHLLSTVEGGIVILASKTPRLGALFEEYVPRLLMENNDIILVIIQNGIHPEHIVIDRAGKLGIKNIEGKLLGAVVLGTAHLVDPHEPKVIHDLGRIQLGCWNTAAMADAKIARVAEMLAPLAEIHVCPDGTTYKRARYRKAALNNANAMCATFGAPLLRLMRNPILGPVTRARLDDFVAVMNANGVATEPDELYEYATHVYCDVFPSHYPSMLRDIEKQIRRREPISTEIGELDVYLCYQANKLGIQVPTTAFIASCFTSYASTYNMLLATSAQSAGAFGKRFINENARLVDEPPFFDDVEGPSQRGAPIFAASAGLAQNFLQLYGEYVHAGRTY